MSIPLSATIQDSCLSATVTGGPSDIQAQYFYTLYGDGQILDTHGPEGAEASFDLERLGFAGGICQIKVVIEYGSEHETAHSTSIFYYHRRCLSYNQLKEETLPTAGLTLYEVEWNGVTFELMFHPVPGSSQLVVFGNGNVRKDVELPTFQRLSWYSQLSCSCLWYFDPSLYLGPARICWGYGTEQRWYLRDISHIVAQIANKLKVYGNDLLFYGSSGGGFTSMLLACMLRGKACVLNPQCVPGHFYPYLVEPMKATCLKPGQNMKEERMNAAVFFQQEGFVPYLLCTQNWGAEDDVYGQLIPFLDELEEAFPKKDRPIELRWFYSDKGHNSWPSELECIQTIQEALAHQDTRLPCGVGLDESIVNVSCSVVQGAVTAKICYSAADSSTRYACYLVDEKKQTIQKQMYQKDSTFTFPVKPGIYGVRAFVSTSGPDQNPTRLAQFSQLVTVYPTVELDYGDIYKIDFCRKQLTTYIIQWDGVSFTFAIRCPPKARKAVVFGPGDVGHRPDLPTFHRLSWAEQVPGCTIYYFDPSVYCGKSGLCWGYGTNQRWYLENIAVLIKKILDRLGIPLTDTLFFGSSGGGYMSILLAAMLHGRAIAINPQLELERDYLSRQKRFRAAVLESEEELLPERTHVLRLLEREGFFPPIQIIQNQTAQMMVIDQLLPFLDQLSQWDKTGVEGLCIQFYNQGGGSGALPCKEDCLKFISDALAHPALKSEPAPCDFPASLLSRLDAGEFDTPSNINRSALSCDFSGVPIPKPIPAVLDEQTISCAQDLIGGKLWVYHRIEPMPYTLNTLNFDTRFSRVPNSFQLYLQGLNPIQILTSAYMENGDKTYLLFAKSFLDAWLSYAVSSNTEKNLYYFSSGHAVSLRAENLMYFGQACAKAGLDVSGLYELLFKHGVWLRDERNFNGTHNYGFMQNQALIHLGYVLNCPEWVTCAKKRLSTQLRSSFDSEYVHLENSPAYADMVIDLVQRTGAYLQAQQDPLGQALLYDIERAQEFMRWAVKPDGMMAQIGDTPTAPPREAMDSLQPPPSGRRFFQQAGYYFYRSSGEKEKKQNTWTMLKAGFSGTTHKHADDTSFFLYSKGQDVFVDCGIYGYANDDFRTYFRSAKAHNTVVVDNGTYSFTQSKRNLLEVEEHQFTPAYDYIRTFNHAYKGVRFTREFISSRDATILIDRISSSQEHLYSQLFHLGEETELLYASDDEVFLKLGKSGYNVRLRQFGPLPELSMFFGDVHNPSYGLISRGENHLEPIYTLKFDLSGKTGLWVTIITVEDHDGTVILQDETELYSNIYYDQAKHCIKLGKTTIPLS